MCIKLSNGLKPSKIHCYVQFVVLSKNLLNYVLNTFLNEHIFLRSDRRRWFRSKCRGSRPTTPASRMSQADIVAILSPNSTAWFLLMAAVLRIGAVPAGINSLLTSGSRLLYWKCIVLHYKDKQFDGAFTNLWKINQILYLHVASRTQYHCEQFKFWFSITISQNNAKFIQQWAYIKI